MAKQTKTRSRPAAAKRAARPAAKRAPGKVVAKRAPRKAAAKPAAARQASNWIGSALTSPMVQEAIAAALVAGAGAAAAVFAGHSGGGARKRPRSASNVLSEAGKDMADAAVGALAGAATDAVRGLLPAVKPADTRDRPNSSRD